MSSGSGPKTGLMRQDQFTGQRCPGCSLDFSLLFNLTSSDDRLFGSMGMSDQLRFGVICNGPSLRRWEAHCVSEILNSGAALLELIVHLGRPSQGPERGAGRHEKRPSLLVRALRKRLSECDAFTPASTEAIFEQTPKLTIEDPGRNRIGEKLPRVHVENLERLGLDFFLGFFGSDIPAEMPRLAQYGIWFFRHDYLEKSGETVPFFLELVRGESTVRVALESFATNPDAMLLLREGRLKIFKHSYRETIDSIYFQCAKWPSWVCKTLLNSGAAVLPLARIPADPMPVPFRRDGRNSPGSRWGKLEGGECLPLHPHRAHDAEARKPDEPLPMPMESPGQAAVWRYAVRALRRVISHKYNSLFRHAQWNIGIVPVPTSRFLDGGQIPKVNYLEITEGRNSFRADPFGLEKDGILTILYEDFDYIKFKGTIRCGQLIEGDRLSNVREVFDMPFHMSYPYLFTSQSEIYCLPESGHDRRARLYRAIRFPDVWVKVCDLVENMAATDSTVFHHDDRWWVAFTDRDHDPDVNLFLWYSDRLEGPWLPHAANPVKTDVRSSRPAGTPFLHQEKLYRPAQDCSERYGRRTVINLVHRLTPNEFREEPVAVVEPPRGGPFSEGLHTLCSVGEITIVDGYRSVFVGAEFRRVVAKRMKKVWTALTGAVRNDEIR